MTRELLRVLLEEGRLNESQVEELLQNLPPTLAELEQLLKDRKWVRESDLLKAKSLILNAPYRELAGIKVSAEVLRLVPEETAVRYRMIPLAKNGSELEVGMVDPGDVQAREALKFVAVKERLTPKIFLIAEHDFNEVLRQYRSLGKEVSQALQELEAELEEEKVKEIAEEGAELPELGAEAPITKVVAVIIRHAVEGQASDIHIEPLEDRTRVRFRVDGVLHSSIYLPQKIHQAIIARIKILSNLKIDETRVPQDGRFETGIKNKKIDFRVSALPTSFGEKIVLRILDPTGGVGQFEDLGLVGRNLEVYKEAIREPYGLVLITGPTGSGKSTTLYTTLSSVNSEELNIITLEDPIEYYIEGVNQSQVRPEIEYTFASGLRSILRQDPDIIMVGEIRDRETAGLATHAALTGHLVFSTLHTNNAIGIIPRLLNMGIENYLLPPTLAAGVAQRLVRRLCPDCKAAEEPPPGVRKIIDEALAGVSPEERKKYGIAEPYQIYKGKGCALCGNKGTKGRVAIYEVFKMTPELEAIVLEDQVSESKLENALAAQGMISMKQDGIMKVLQGLVSMEEVLNSVET
jgi:type IV pilus assembly protein PilB